MTEQISSPAPAPTPEQASPNANALLSGAVVAAGAATLFARPARAVTPALTFADIPGTGDVKVLNYALALEALEADLYRQAVARLTTLNVSATQPDRKFIEKFSVVETDHRDFLIAGIRAAGATPITESTLNGAIFDFNINSLDRMGVLDLVLDAEATGVRAYLGAIVKFTVQSAYLPIAAAIQGTEARHTTILKAVRNELFGRTDPVAPQFTVNHGIDTTLTPNAVLAHVSPFIVLPS